MMYETRSLLRGEHPCMRRNAFVISLCVSLARVRTSELNVEASSLDNFRSTAELANRGLASFLVRQLGWEETRYSRRGWG